MGGEAALAADTVGLWQRGATGAALRNAAGTLGAGLLAPAAGLALTAAAVSSQGTPPERPEGTAALRRRARL